MLTDGRKYQELQKQNKRQDREKEEAAIGSSVQQADDHKETESEPIIKKATDPLTREMNEIENRMSENIRLLIQEVMKKANFRISLEVASFYEMCDNCKSTYLHDIITKKEIQRVIFLNIIDSVDSKLRGYILWYLTNSAFDKDDNPFLNFSYVSLLVSSNQAYE